MEGGGGCSRGEGWTHVDVIGEHQQYFLKRLLKLDSTLVEEMRARKIITKKVKVAIEKENYNMDYFLAILKTKKVEKFVQFLELLEATFVSNENHKVLVSTMSEYLVQMVGVNEADTATIERIVTSSQSEETRTMLPKVAKERVVETELGLFEPLCAQLPQGTQKEESTTLPSPKPVMEVESQKSEKFSANVCVKPPKGFVEPKQKQSFSRESLEGLTTWTFHSVEHGLTITIDNAAVPVAIDEFSITMHAYLCGSFEIPEEYEICTALFILRLEPNFKFCKPVSIKFPHSVVVEDDDVPEDFVVLHAFDPDTKSANSEYLYKFSEIITETDYSEYYVTVQMDQFCTVAGAKRRRKYHNRASLPFNASGVGKQRRKRRSVMKRKMKKLLSGESTGSSRHSSFEASFDRNPLLSKQSSSEQRESSDEGQRSLPRQLRRQLAMQHYEGLSDESNVENYTSCNEVRIMCCCPVQSCANWTTTFLVAPNTPTGEMVCM